MCIRDRQTENLETHIGFIDYSKAYDRVSKRILWGIIGRDRPQLLTEVIKGLSENTEIVVSTKSDRTRPIVINRGVRQEFGLSLTLPIK